MAKRANARREVPAPGEQIKQIRAETGISQITLAERLGTSQSAIARLESPDYDGHSVQSLRKAAEALGRRLLIRFVTEDEYDDAAGETPEPTPDAERPRRGRPRRSEGS